MVDLKDRRGWPLEGFYARGKNSGFLHVTDERDFDAREELESAFIAHGDEQGCLAVTDERDGLR